jgi:hypothetical protein
MKQTWKSRIGLAHAGSRINFRTTFPDSFSKSECKNEISSSALLDVQRHYFVSVEWIHLSQN